MEEIELKLRQNATDNILNDDLNSLKEFHRAYNYDFRERKKRQPFQIPIEKKRHRINKRSAQQKLLNNDVSPLATSPCCFNIESSSGYVKLENQSPNFEIYPKEHLNNSSTETGLYEERFQAKFKKPSLHNRKIKSKKRKRGKNNRKSSSKKISSIISEELETHGTNIISNQRKRSKKENFLSINLRKRQQSISHKQRKFRSSSRIRAKKDAVFISTSQQDVNYNSHVTILEREGSPKILHHPSEKESPKRMNIREMQIGSPRSPNFQRRKLDIDIDNLTKRSKVLALADKDEENSVKSSTEVIEKCSSLSSRRIKTIDKLKTISQDIDKALNVCENIEILKDAEGTTTTTIDLMIPHLKIVDTRQQNINQYTDEEEEKNKEPTSSLSVVSDFSIFHSDEHSKTKERSISQPNLWCTSSRSTESNSFSMPPFKYQTPQCFQSIESHQISSDNIMIRPQFTPIQQYTENSNRYSSENNFKNSDQFHLSSQALGYSCNSSDSRPEHNSEYLAANLQKELRASRPGYYQEYLRTVQPTYRTRIRPVTANYNSNSPWYSTNDCNQNITNHNNWDSGVNQWTGVTNLSSIYRNPTILADLGVINNLQNQFHSQTANRTSTSEIHGNNFNLATNNITASNISNEPRLQATFLPPIVLNDISPEQVQNVATRMGLTVITPHKENSCRITEIIEEEKTPESPSYNIIRGAPNQEHSAWVNEHSTKEQQQQQQQISNPKNNHLSNPKNIDIIQHTTTIDHEDENYETQENRNEIYQEIEMQNDQSIQGTPTTTNNRQHDDIRSVVTPSPTYDCESWHENENENENVEEYNSNVIRSISVPSTTSPRTSSSKNSSKSMSPPWSENNYISPNCSDTSKTTLRTNKTDNKTTRKSGKYHSTSNHDNESKYLVRTLKRTLKTTLSKYFVRLKEDLLNEVRKEIRKLLED